MKPPPWESPGEGPGEGLTVELAALQAAVDLALDRVPAEALDPCDLCVLDAASASPACGCDCAAPRVVEKRDSCIQTSPMFEFVGSIPHIDSDEEEETSERQEEGRNKTVGPVSTGKLLP